MSQAPSIPTDLVSRLRPFFAEACLEVALGELGEREFCARLAHIIDRDGGVPCGLLLLARVAPDGSPALHDVPVQSPGAAKAILDGVPRTSIPLVTRNAQTVGELVAFGGVRAELEPVAGVVTALLFWVRAGGDASAPREHRHKNQLAALLSNVELAELIVSGSKREIDAEQRGSLARALGLAADAARALIGDER